jgi:hypothetical protein
MGDPVAWRGVSYDSPVFADDGTKVGTVHEILGSDSEDIFHGVRVRLTNKRDVMVSSDDVTNLSTDGVSTRLTRTAVEALPTFADTQNYHLSSVGWLRKHLGWRQDSKSDEEAG